MQGEHLATQAVVALTQTGTAATQITPVGVAVAITALVVSGVGPGMTRCLILVGEGGRVMPGRLLLTVYSWAAAAGQAVAITLRLTRVHTPITVFRVPWARAFVPLVLQAGVS